MVSSSRIRGWVAVSVAALVPVSGVVGAGSASPSALEAVVPASTVPGLPASTEPGVVPPTSDPAVVPSTSEPITAPPVPGVATPIKLPAPAAIGQVAYVQVAIQTTIDGGPVNLALSTSSSVTNVNGDGSFTSRSTIDSVDVTNAPASADISAWGFDEVQGVSFVQSFASTGRPVDNISRSVDAKSLILDFVSMSYIGFPASAIFVGDSWNVDGTIGSDGLAFHVTYQCRLAAVANDSYTIDVSYAANFSSPIAGGVADGTISGSGTLTGSLANPLVVSGGLNQTIDGVRTVDGAATPMRTDTSVTLTAIGG